MKKRPLGRLSVQALGLGAMGLSHGYGPAVSPQQAETLLLDAVAQGVDWFDTSPAFGQGDNERLLGRVLAPHRASLVWSTRAGVTPEGEVDGRPSAIRAHCEASLGRLQTDVIDLLVLHRVDPAVPMEESVGAMADLVQAGKVREIGLSEVSAPLLRRGHAVHRVAAVATEYALWSRQPEIAVSDACQALGVALVATSPLGRGGLTARLTDPSRLAPDDLRRRIPRFDVLNYAANLRLLDRWVPLVAEWGCTPAQAALAWLLHRGDHVLALPGTTQQTHLHENLAALDLPLGPDALARMDRLFHPDEVCGPRANPHDRRFIQTEEFDS
jgi:hypothetical protein